MECVLEEEEKGSGIFQHRGSKNEAENYSLNSKVKKKMIA